MVKRQAERRFGGTDNAAGAVHACGEAPAAETPETGVPAFVKVPGVSEQVIRS